MATAASIGTLLRPCTAPGCTTLTLGVLCLQHEPPVGRVFPRGRPFPPAVAAEPAVAQLRLPRKISA